MRYLNIASVGPLISQHDDLYLQNTKKIALDTLYDKNLSQKFINNEGTRTSR